MKTGLLIMAIIGFSLLLLPLKSVSPEKQVIQQINDSLQIQNKQLEFQIETLNKAVDHFQDLVKRQKWIRKKLQNEKDKSIYIIEHFTDDELFEFFSTVETPSS
jgi:uncharacterized membrane protein YhiD involved in acid resistance